MRPFVFYASHVMLCAGLFTAAHIGPAPQAAVGRAVEAPPPQVSRLAERADIEQLLANARPPVPWVREHKLAAYVPPKEVEPAVAVATVAAAVAPPPVAAFPPTASFRSAPRVTAAATWHRAATRGSTDLAVTATP
jgi:hypothetical protein